jgi:tripartite-type tricarboxylate transporter receptor subunit TctC
MISRRTAIGLIGLGLPAIAATRAAAALDYPTRPVRFVTGYPPGGATDIIARLVGQRLSERLGQQFVVENRAPATISEPNMWSIRRPTDTRCC